MTFCYISCLGWYCNRPRSMAALLLLTLASLLHAINIFLDYNSQLPSLVFKQRCVPFSLMIINYEVREVKFHQIFSSFQQQNIMYYWRHLLFFTRDPPLSILKTFKSIQDLISLMDIQIKVNGLHFTQMKTEKC